MSKDDTPPICENVELLEEAVARNQSVELQYTDASGVACSVKTRLLMMDDQYLYLDTPTNRNKRVRLDVNSSVHAYTHINRQIYAFQAKIVRTDCLIEINSNKKVQGIQITKPSKVSESQRRNNYRVSMASMAPVDVTLYESSPMNSDGELLQAKGTPAHMTNLSSGGCGITLPLEVASGFRTGEKLFICFDLPDENPTFVFQVLICQIVPVAGNQTMRLGLQYVEWPDHTQFGRKLRPLEKFIADAQRAEARRVKLDRRQ